MKAPKKLKAKTIKQILKDAENRYPREACGVIVIDKSDNKTEIYVPCKNIATDETQEFVICPESFAQAEETGTVVGIVHSHPDQTTRPSLMDIAVMSRHRELELEIDPDSNPIPWHIVSWPEGDYRQVVPEVNKSLLGRPFVHNIWDCWASCEAYYKKYHNIEFPSVERVDLWWEDKNAESMYEARYEDWGFYQVESPEPGDMIVMQIGRTYHPNHAGIYLGDVTEFEGVKFHGSPLMFHHLWGQDSNVIVYGGQWSQRARLILRHKGVKHE